MDISALCLFFFLLGVARSVDFSFENGDSGFFFEQSSSSSLPQLSTTFPTVHSAPGPRGRTVLRKRLTVTRPSHPSKLGVSHGPFETKQTIPAQFVVPEIDFTSNTSQASNVGSYALDVTAHFVSTELRRENPVVRVLFHAGRHIHNVHGSSGGQDVDDLESDDNWDNESSSLAQLCIVLYTQGPSGGSPLLTTCSPQGVDGVCLATQTVPFEWWPHVHPSPILTTPSFSTQKPSKAPRSSVEFSYAVYETKSGHCESFSSRAWHSSDKLVKPRSHKKLHVSAGFPPAGSVLIQPQIPLSPARLLPNTYAYRDLLANEAAGPNVASQLRLITPAAPLYPGSLFYVSVVVDSPSSAASYKEEPYAVTVRAKVKSGLRIIGASSSNSAWTLNAEINGKHSTAVATAVRNFSVAVPHTGSQELFTWLLAVDVEEKETTELVDGVRVLWAWTVRNHAPYRPARPEHHRDSPLDSEKRKATTRFEILKDEVHSVLPVIKVRELVNTAALTGRQVSEPLRVYMVSQGGKLADVTLQTTCSSADESLIKVSSSCTSVYLDGSEIRGSKNATVVARYGNAVGTSSVTVWVPEIPLDVQIDDVKLNLISGWRVPTERNGCKPRYQQTNYQLFAKFFAEDHDSGRVSYFLSRKTYIQVTDLVRKFVRLSDPRVASLKQGLIEGVKIGRTELQVLSPMTGQVIGSREVRVSGEKVDITHASVQVISGLSMSIKADPDLEFCYTAQVDFTEKLSAKYQEAILDTALYFNDGTFLALAQIDRHHFHLTTEGRNASIVTLTSAPNSPVPRVLALSEGKASVAFTVDVSDSCRVEGQSHPLATSEVTVVVFFGDNTVTGVQNDARTGQGPVMVTQSYTLSHSDAGPVSEHGAKRRPSHNSSARISQGQLTFSKPGLSDLSEGQLSLKDDSNAHAGLGYIHTHGFSITSSSHHPPQLTPLEIGMYVLLAVFCGAICVFAGTCIVYATRARKAHTLPEDYSVLPTTSALGIEQVWNKWRKKGDPPPESPEGGDPQETSDKNWVWLGRSTLDNPAVQMRSSSNQHSDPNGNQGQGKQCTDKDINRLSGISYSGSEVSVRILTHARPQDGGRLTYTAELCIPDCSQSLRTPTDPESDNDPDVFVHAPRVIDSSTYTKHGPVNIVTNPNFDQAESKVKSVGVTAKTMSPVSSPTNINETLLDNDNSTGVNVKRRPKSNRVPYHLDENDTRRYARSWLLAGEPVPRDLNRNSQTEIDDNSNFAGTDNGHCLATFVRRSSPDIKRANIVENPRFSATLSDDENTSFAIVDNGNIDCNAAVDYDQIMAYLGRLKESSA